VNHSLVWAAHSLVLVAHSLVWAAHSLVLVAHSLVWAVHSLVLATDSQQRAEGSPAQAKGERVGGQV
jgi:hypothetical protein